MIVSQLPSPKDSEIVLVRVLSPKSAGWLVEKCFDVSRDEHADSISKMLRELNLDDLIGREFVCFYAFTRSSWKHFKAKLSGMSCGLDLAIVLDPKKVVPADKLLIFNGDVQNLAKKDPASWWYQSYGEYQDTTGLAEEIECRILSSQGVKMSDCIYSLVPEARLYSRLTPNFIKLIYNGKPDDQVTSNYAQKIEKLVKTKH